MVGIMLLLKTNPELKIVFAKLIGTVKAPVNWQDIFAVKNNKLILVGDIRSLIFDFDNQTVAANIVDIPLENKEIDTIPNDAMINNMLNIVLYAFGKWGAIGGLKVEKDYAALSVLFQNVFRPIRVEPEYGNEIFCFFKNGVKITYEDVLQEAMELLREEGKVPEDENNAVTSDDEGAAGEEDTESSDSEAAGLEEDGRAKKKNSPAYQMEDDDYELGLWHSMCWKMEKRTFEKSQQSESDTVKSRIGRNFYMTGFQCPECGEKLYMAVYPVDKELLIETEEARVFIARAYTCNTCNLFYTPRPGKLIQEGDVYSLKFDVDRTAYEDYLEVLGARAEKTVNSKFNEYESERKKGKNAGMSGQEESGHSADAQMEDELSEEEKQAVGQDGKTQKRGFVKGIFARHAEQTKRGDLNKDSKHAGSGEMLPRFTTGSGIAESADTAEVADIASVTENTSKAENVKTPNTTEAINSTEIKESSGGIPVTENSAIVTENNKESNADTIAQIKTKLSVKTTEELKNILKSVKESGNIHAVTAAGAEVSGDTNVTEYIETVKAVLEEKLTAKYEARMGALDNLSLRQLSDLKKQLQEEEVLPEVSWLLP